jgi:sugar/nucleoside kinase (ribokinase family)
VGLEALPGPGDECFAGDLLRSPGGGAITAIGGARLGLKTVLASPVGDDIAGEFVRELLTAEGVEVGPPRGRRTPTTVVMPVGGERAMVTVDPGVRATAADVARAEPRAVVANLELADLVPDGARGYLTCGDDDARAYAGGRLEGRLQATRALICDTREACILTGADSPREAARRLAELGPDSVVVNQGPDGAVAALDGRLIDVPAADVGRGVDPTGDRDLLAAAYAWADLRGAAPEDGLRWGILYAALSVLVPTGAAGAVSSEQLLEEGRRRGLAAPPGA